MNILLILRHWFQAFGQKKAASSRALERLNVTSRATGWSPNLSSIHSLLDTPIIGCSEVLNIVLFFLLLPEGKVLLKKLNDGLGISEGLLIDVVNLLKSIRQSLLSEFTGLLVVVHHFVVETEKFKASPS